MTPLRRDCSPIKCIRIVSGVGIGIGVGRRDGGNWLLKFRDNRGKFRPVCSATFQTQKSARLSRDRGGEIGWMALWRLCQMDRPTYSPKIRRILSLLDCWANSRTARGSRNVGCDFSVVSWRITIYFNGLINRVHGYIKQRHDEMKCMTMLD